jgi:GntR family transcriptional regulator
MEEHKRRSGQTNKPTPDSAKPARSAPKWDFEPIDKNSFIPIYFQIQTQLLEMIKLGRLHPGDPLPSEEELSRVYGVSRMTSRHALQSLKGQGFATRVVGQGTFVSQPKVEKDITHLCGFTAEMRALGMKPTSRVLEAKTIAATPEVASQLAVAVGSPIFNLRRLRLADGLPVAIEQIWLSQDRFPGIDKVDLAHLSLYQTLRERYDIRVSRADEILESRAAHRSEAELLEMAPRVSLLVISRTLWDSGGKPVETAHSLYRGDRYRAVLSIPATTVE